MTDPAAPGRPVIELGFGVVVYPARVEGGRWRAVWYEDGQRCQCESVDEGTLAARLEKVTERLAAGAPNMRRTGADLIAFYLDPDRLPADKRWSRKHAHTQARLCQRFAAPVIGTVTCQDITPGHTQQIVNAAPTPGEPDTPQCHSPAQRPRHHRETPRARSRSREPGERPGSGRPGHVPVVGILWGS